MTEIDLSSVLALFYRPTAFKDILHPCCGVLHPCSETHQFGLFGSQGGRGSVFFNFSIKNTLAPLNVNAKTINESSREHCVCVRGYLLVGLMFNCDSNILIKCLILGASGHCKTWAWVSEHGELSCKFRRRGTGHSTGFHCSHQPTPQHKWEPPLFTGRMSLLAKDGATAQLTCSCSYPYFNFI